MVEHTGGGESTFSKNSVIFLWINKTKPLPPNWTWWRAWWVKILFIKCGVQVWPNLIDFISKEGYQLLTPLHPYLPFLQGTTVDKAISHLEEFSQLELWWCNGGREKKQVLPLSLPLPLHVTLCGPHDTTRQREPWQNSQPYCPENPPFGSMSPLGWTILLGPPSLRSGRILECLQHTW